MFIGKDKTMLRATEAAKRIGFTLGSFYNMRHHVGFPQAVETIGSAKFWRAADLDKWLEQKQRRVAP